MPTEKAWVELSENVAGASIGTPESHSSHATNCRCTSGVTTKRYRRVVSSIRCYDCAWGSRGEWDTGTSARSSQSESVRRYGKSATLIERDTRDQTYHTQ